MNKNNKKTNSILFNLIALLTFGFAFFLIIFLKQGKGKKVEHQREEKSPGKGRVKIAPQTPPSKDQIKKSEKKSEDLKNLNQRQIKILERIKKQGRMEPGEIYELVPNVSTRTVRRDMDKLVKAGFVTQKGTTKATQYIFNS